MSIILYLYVQYILTHEQTSETQECNQRTNTSTGYIQSNFFFLHSLVRIHSFIHVFGVHLHSQKENKMLLLVEVND